MDEPTPLLLFPLEASFLILYAFFWLCKSMLDAEKLVCFPQHHIRLDSAALRNSLQAPTNPGPLTPVLASSSDPRDTRLLAGSWEPRPPFTPRTSGKEYGPECGGEQWAGPGDQTQTLLCVYRLFIALQMFIHPTSPFFTSMSMTFCPSATQATTPNIFCL